MIAEDIKDHMLSTYVSLRRLIVVVTLAFLVTLSAYRLSGHETNRNSISAYYYHDNTGFRMKDVFVGALTSVALLLIAYQGYTDREKWALDLAGMALLGVVAFPMDWPPDEHRKSSPIEIVHYSAAALFYLAISYVCLLRAHDTLEAMRNEQRKAMFRQLYRLTGALLLMIPLTTLVLRQFAWWLYGVEYAGVIVFLAYWVIKSFEMRLTRLETEEKVEKLADECPKERRGTEPPIPHSEP